MQWKPLSEEDKIAVCVRETEIGNLIDKDTDNRCHSSYHTVDDFTDTKIPKIPTKSDSTIL